MGFFDRIFGSNTTTVSTLGPPPAQGDAQALERYRYLLRTAPPDAVEQAHAEAFAALTPEQRIQAANALNPQLAEPERIAAANASDPRALARAATRAELTRPGSLERTFGGFGGTLMSSIAGTFIGSAIAHQFLGGFDEPAAASEPEASADDGATDDSFGGDDFGD